MNYERVALSERKRSGESPLKASNSQIERLTHLSLGSFTIDFYLIIKTWILSIAIAN